MSTLQLVLFLVILAITVVVVLITGYPPFDAGAVFV